MLRRLVQYLEERRVVEGSWRWLMAVADGSFGFMREKVGRERKEKT